MITTDHVSPYTAEEWEQLIVLVEKLGDDDLTRQSRELADIASRQRNASTQAGKDEFAGKTHLAAILDASGSMSHIEHTVLSGYNEWLESVKQAQPGASLLQVLFNHEVFHRTFYSSVTQAHPLVSSIYHPSGATALYDALDVTIDALEEEAEAGDRVLVCVITDGQENSSRNTCRENVLARIKKLEDGGNWTFTYLSAVPEAFADAGIIGIQVGNITTFAQTQAGAKDAFRTLTNATKGYLGGVGGQSATFYGAAEDFNP